MSSQENGYQWQELEVFALQDTAKGWEMIDRQLQDLTIYEKAEYIQAALKCLRSKKGPLQDLGATFFQDMPEEQFHTVTNNNSDIYKVLESQMTKGASTFAQFRASFALYVHGYETCEVISKIRDALKEPDVADIAKRLLGQL